MEEPLSQFSEEVKALYKSGLSSTEISQKLDCSVHKVVYWLDKAGIVRRKPSEALYLKYNPSGDPFHIKQVAALEDAFLHGLGSGIYWGEGNKKKRSCCQGGKY